MILSLIELSSGIRQLLMLSLDTTLMLNCFLPFDVYTSPSIRDQRCLTPDNRSVNLY